jgi:hypothetical protein
MMTIPTQDFTEAARTWRKRAEVLWTLSKLLDDLAGARRLLALTRASY